MKIFELADKANRPKASKYITKYTVSSEVSELRLGEGKLFRANHEAWSYRAGQIGPIKSILPYNSKAKLRAKVAKQSKASIQSIA